MLIHEMGTSSMLSFFEILLMGILGLGFPSLSEYHATPFFSTLVAQGVLPTNSFGLCSSDLYIGRINSKLYEGDFTNVPVTMEVRLCIEVP